MSHQDTFTDDEWRLLVWGLDAAAICVMRAEAFAFSRLLSQLSAAAMEEQRMADPDESNRFVKTIVEAHLARSGATNQQEDADPDVQLASALDDLRRVAELLERLPREDAAAYRGLVKRVAASVAASTKEDTEQGSVEVSDAEAAALEEIARALETVA